MPDVTQLSLALLNGIAWGLTISLVGLGLSIIFGLLDIVNMAHGALYMMGAVGAFFLIAATGSFWLALVAVPIVVGVLGIVGERTILKPVEGDIDLTLIVTFGVSFVLEQLGLLVFGPGTQVIDSPIHGHIAVGTQSYPLYRIFVAVLAVIAIGAFYLFLYRTRYGLWMRGVRQDVEIAEALGIPANRVYPMTFGIGALFAGLAGVLIAPMTGVNHLMGLDILGIAFVVVIVGGLGSMSGVIITGLIFGILQNLGTVFFNLTEARFLVFVVFGILILLRPNGIRGSS